MNSYSEDNLIEQPAMELLRSIGWDTVNCYDEKFGEDGTLGRTTPAEVVLVRYLKDAMRRLNPDIGNDALNVAADEITKDRSSLSAVSTNREIYKLIKDGVPVNYRDERGEEVENIVQVVDWKNHENNSYLMANQLWITGAFYKRRADIVGFINGLPLVFMELKAAHKRVEDAFTNNLRDYKDTIPQLFWYNGFIILSNGSKSKIGSITSTMDFFNEWKKVSSEDEPIKVSLEAMLRGTCDIARILDILENFVLFKDESIKIIGKNHQFFGVNNAIDAVRNMKTREGKLGVFWHTQGSGKSFSMIFLTQKILRKIPGNWTFIIVTDRTDLDTQIYRTFNSVGISGGVQADSCENLKRLLQQDKKMIFTLIQKFKWEDVSEPVTLRGDVIVITDEAHRSQYDTLARNMRKALPNASFIGFTGTPLVEGDTITRDVFGDYVSVYDFSAAVVDGTTVPLYYENRIPELQLINEDLNDDLTRVIEEAMLDEAQESKLEREFLREYHLITREERLDKIAQDIVEHFMGRGYMGKAMVVSIDKMTAVRMYFKVQKEWQRQIERLEKAEKKSGAEEKLQYMKETEMAVIISSSQNEIDDFRKNGIDILPLRKSIQNGGLDEKFKDASHPLRIVFVCAMWITGFDVQSLSTVYLDKPMRNHTLMQTVARANRVFEGKNNGLIVDYVGVFRNLQKALSIYAAQEGSKIDAPIKEKGELLADLAEAIKQAREFCVSCGVDLGKIINAVGFEKVGLLDDAVDCLVANDEEILRFKQLASLAWRIFKATLPDKRAYQYEDICQLLSKLLEKINTISPSPDIGDVMKGISDVLDVSIDTRGYVISSSPENVVDLSALDFEKMRRDFEKARKNIELQKLKNTIEQVLSEIILQNKTRTDYLKRFEAMIAEYNSGSKNVDVIYKELIDFAAELSDEQKRHIGENLSEEQLALFDILTKPEMNLSEKEKEQVKLAARDLLKALKKEKLVLDWRKKQQARADVLYTIQSVLDEELPRSYSPDLFRSKCESVYQRIFDNYIDANRNIYDMAV